MSATWTLDLDLEPHVSNDGADAQERAATNARRRWLLLGITAALAGLALPFVTGWNTGKLVAAKPAASAVAPKLPEQTGPAAAAPAPIAGDASAAPALFLGGAALQDATRLVVLAAWKLRASAGDNEDLYERYLARGDRLFFAGRSRASLKWYRKAARLRPEVDRAWWAMGRSYHDLGRNVTARRKLEKALRLNPRAEMAHLVLGSVYQALGRPAAAARYYEAYLALAPTGALARDAGHLAPIMRRKTLDLPGTERVAPVPVLVGMR